MIRCGVGRWYVSAACFRGSHAMAMYNSPLRNPVQAVKASKARGKQLMWRALYLEVASLTRRLMHAQVAGMVLISMALVLRSARLFIG